MNILTLCVSLFLAYRPRRGLYYDLWTLDLQLTESERTERIAIFLFWHHTGRRTFCYLSVPDTDKDGEVRPDRSAFKVTRL